MESEIIGSILSGEQALIRALELLDLDDFSLPINRSIFSCCKELNELKLTPTSTSVCSRLVVENLDGKELFAHLNHCIFEACDPEDIDYFCFELKSKSRRNKLIQAGSVFTQDLKDGKELTS